MHGRALLALGFTVVIWGATSVFIRAFSLAVGPYDALVIRLVAVAMVFATALAFTTGFSLAWRDWPKLLTISLFGMLGYYAFSVYGFVYAPAGIGSLIMSTQPMLIALLASLVGAEKLTPMTIVGLIVAFAGSVILVWGDDLGTATASSTDVIYGCFLIFLASIALSVFVVFSKSLIQTHGALKITGLSNIIIVLPLLPFLSASTMATALSLNRDAVLSLLFLTFLGATSSVVTWNYAVAIVKPSLLGAALYVVPLIAVFAGWLMLDELVTFHVIIAGLIILAGVAVSQMKWRARSRELNADHASDVNLLR